MYKLCLYKNKIIYLTIYLNIIIPIEEKNKQLGVYLFDMFGMVNVKV